METGPKGCSAWRLDLRGVALGAHLVVEEGTIVPTILAVTTLTMPTLTIPCRRGGRPPRSHLLRRPCWASLPGWGE
eukprot:scaffold77555_cov53-Phaeocystis_antarctica.AAC.1